MDLPIAIPIRTDGAEEKLKGVEAGLHKAEDQGVSAARAMQNLSDAFKKLGQQIRQEQEAAERAHEVHDRLTRQNQPLARSFRALGEAIAKEQHMLERIHGPARQYAEDLRVLDKLLDENKISTEQYANEVSRLNRNLESTPAPQRPTGGGMGATASMLGVAAGPALIGTGLALGHGIEGIIREHEQLKDRYTELTNKALEFAKDGRSVNSVLEMQGNLARDLRSTLMPTMELFDGVSDATRNLGMTTQDQIDLARVLGQEMNLQHKPLAEAGSLLQRLSVALETGAGAGRQFRTIMAEYPELADAAAEAFNTDLGGLAKLIEDGKVKLPELTKAWTTHSREIVDLHGQQKETIKQANDRFVEEAEILMNKGVPAQLAFNQAGRELYKTFENMRNPGQDANKVLGDITATIAEQARKAKAAADALEGQRESILALRRLKEEEARDDAKKEAAKQKALEEKYAADAMRDQKEGDRKAAEEARKLNAVLKERLEIGRRLVGSESATQRAIREGVQNRAEFQADVDRAVDEEIESEERAYKATIEFTDAKIKAEEDWKDAVAKYTDEAAAKRIKAAKEEQEAQKKVLDDMIRTVEPLGEALGKAFSGGDKEAKDFLDTLTDVGFQLAKIAAMQAFGPLGGLGVGFLQGLLGGKTGFDYTVGSDPLQRPGFADGGDFMVRGPGSTDSKLVQFWASPGETVSVRTPEQRMATMRGAGADPWVPELLDAVRSLRLVIATPGDRRSVADSINTHQVERALHEVESRNRRRARRT